MKAATPGERGALGARERILAAATDLAGREGLEALTTRRVARVAGVNVGLLHYYFESKESLIDETLGLFLDEMLATAIAPIAAATPAEPAAPIAAATPAAPATSAEDLLSAIFCGALDQAWKRPGLIFGLIGRLAAAVAKSTRDGGVPGAESGGGPPLPLGPMVKIQAALFDRIRPLLVARLGENPDLVGRRAVQLFTSLFHPALFTPFPGLIFGVDLENEAERHDYVRAIVRDALEPPRLD